MTDDAIQLTTLRFGWPNQSLLLAIDELQVAIGEKLFLQGASGSGKSTLLGILGGVLQPQQGEVCVLGQSLTALGQTRRDAFRAAHIGFIFQLFNLLPYLSVLDNVLLPCRFSAVRRQRAQQQQRSIRQEAVRLLNHLHLPEALWQRPVTNLSVGQQQRVAVARALIGRPELLIADEPTSALDHDSRAAFLDLLLTECNAMETTVIFVSHDPTLARYFDRSLSLVDINGSEVACL